MFYKYVCISSMQDKKKFDPSVSYISLLAFIKAESEHLHKQFAVENLIENRNGYDLVIKLSWRDYRRASVERKLERAESIRTNHST